MNLILAEAPSAQAPDALEALDALDAAEATAVPGPRASVCASPPSPVVAIMQPYIFPYLGYLGLASCADVFVFYDDVQHIPRGWINRNRILVNGTAHTFTVPVVKASQNLRIDAVQLHDFGAFRSRFLRQLACAYRRAPHFEATQAWVSEVLATEPADLADLAIRSVEASARLLGVAPTFVRSSERCAASRSLPRAERLRHITHQLGGYRYVNPPGGAALYDPAEFAAHGVQLRFVQPVLAPYAQLGGGAFVPGLSVIDALMHLPVPEVARRVRQLTLQ